MGTLNTQAMFSGTPGQTYYFRARATDRAQNVEGWPAGDGDGQVTFYDWQLTGTVRDNAGAPVGGAQVAVSPNGLASPPSDLTGEYAAYALQTTPEYTATWSKPGYGLLPATRIDAGQDGRIRVVLPPADNVVQNWGFESGNLNNWQTMGPDSAIITDTLSHSGRYSALIGGNPLALTSPIRVLTTTSMSGFGIELLPDNIGRCVKG